MSTTFPTFNLNYCQVCGRLRGYQFGTPGAFVRSNSLSQASHLIHSMLMGSPLHMVIVVLVSISGPTLLVFTTDRPDRFACPCNNNTFPDVLPPAAFVGSNYYCESAASSHTTRCILSKWCYVGRAAVYWLGRSLLQQQSKPTLVQHNTTSWPQTMTLNWGCMWWWI